MNNSCWSLVFEGFNVCMFNLPETKMACVIRGLWSFTLQRDKFLVSIDECTYNVYPRKIKWAKYCKFGVKFASMCVCVCQHVTGPDTVSRSPGVILLNVSRHSGPTRGQAVISITRWVEGDSKVRTIGRTRWGLCKLSWALRVNSERRVEEGSEGLSFLACKQNFCRN